MPRKNETSFESICKRNASAGYVLDQYIVIKRATITEAQLMTSQNIVNHLKKLESGWKAHVKYFYIGKTHISIRKKCTFNPLNPQTWKLADGISQRFCYHKSKDYGKNGLIVVAVVNKASIKNDCKEDGYIKHHEEYALILEKRLMEHFKDRRLANDSEDPGRTDKGASIAYAVYMAFTMQTTVDPSPALDYSGDNTTDESKDNNIPTLQESAQSEGSSRVQELSAATHFTTKEVLTYENQVSVTKSFSQGIIFPYTCIDGENLDENGDFPNSQESTSSESSSSVHQLLVATHITTKDIPTYTNQASVTSSFSQGNCISLYIH